MYWAQHISEISSKATKTIGFLLRNLAFAPKNNKEVAYKTLVQLNSGVFTKIQISDVYLNIGHCSD